MHHMIDETTPACVDLRACVRAVAALLAYFRPTFALRQSKAMYYNDKEAGFD